MRKHPIIYTAFFCFFIFTATAQQSTDSILINATLDECVQYALAHQPSYKQAQIDEQVVDAEIKTRLADWYPQINLDYTYQHYFKVPVIIFDGRATPSAQKNFSTAYFSLTQNVFNRDVLLASRTAGNVRAQAKQITVNSKIYIVLYVSKAFYDVLLAQEQINLVNQDITRLDRSVKDAFNQYKAGIVDKTDYKRAQISLNNSLAQKKQYQQALSLSFSVLKLLMGYPQSDSINLVYDSVQIKNEIYLDTLQQVNYTNRIEYKLLQTQQSLLQSNLNYYRWGFFPDISAFGNYNFTFANNNFSKLYGTSYPSSYLGLTLSFPIFQGGKRIWQIRSAKLQLNRLQYNFISLRDSIQSEYTRSLAFYKAYLNDYHIQHDNLELAQDVYNTINLQYRAGIKTYLEVIVAESDLRNSQVNYLNALYDVLKSKLDVEKALGTLTY